MPRKLHQPNVAGPERPYPAVPYKPTQIGPRDILFDFNFGARLWLPERTEGQWKVVLKDLDTDNILFVSENQGAFVSSSKTYYVRFGIEVYEINSGEAIRVFSHPLNLRGKRVIIEFPIGTLGDIIGWFPYAAKFSELHECDLVCAMSPLLVPLFCEKYPKIAFVSHEELVAQDLQASTYATYRLGLFFDDVDHRHQPTDFRLVGLHRTAAYILGVDPEECRPQLSKSSGLTPIEAPYVCIAVQCSSQAKCWNNPSGWLEVVSFLKQSGFRVLCIDQKRTHGIGLIWNHIPNGAEDETGDRPLLERAHLLRHAAFFVGLSSGLSWLAWAVGTPVVLISGFTHPVNEFKTPYRVVNWHACNSCWNDPTERFDHHEFLWCPRHGQTPRQFECSRLITSMQVIETIRRVPAFDLRKPMA